MKLSMLFAELQSRLLAGEARRARQIASPSTQTGTPAGTRENAGFRYALHGPLVSGVAQFDPATAEELLRRMMLAHLTNRNTVYWTGQWSVSGSLNASRLAATERSEIDRIGESKCFKSTWLRCLSFGELQ